MILFRDTREGLLVTFATGATVLLTKAASNAYNAVWAIRKDGTPVTPRSISDMYKVKALEAFLEGQKALTVVYGNGTINALVCSQ